MRLRNFLFGAPLVIAACTRNGRPAGIDAAWLDAEATAQEDARADALTAKDQASVKAVCTPGMDQSCNENPALSSLHRRCNADPTCTCTPPFVVNPSTGLCL